MEKQKDLPVLRHSLKDRLPILLLISAFILGLSVAVQFSHAQSGIEGQSLEVSPPSQEINADPGKTLTIKAKVRNRAQDPVPVTVRIEDFTAQGEEGQVALTEKGPWAVSTWTTVTPTQFQLTAGQTQEVTATVRIPATGVAGGRYGSFVFAVEGVKPKGAGVASVAQEVASLFLIRVSGTVSERMAIDSFTAPAFMEFGPVPLTVKYRNDGNVHLKPKGVIAITDMFGQKVTDVVVDGVNVFPGAARSTTTTWQTQLGLGKYTATALIYTGGSKNETMTSTATFILFPIRIAVVVALILFGLYLLRKRIGKSLKALMGK
jgi:hypothetical protein